MASSSFHQKKTVYPPEEVKNFLGFTFCIVGSCVSSAFLGIDPPPNVGNKKIILTAPSSSNEMNEVKKSLAAKDKEISRLQKENLRLNDEILKMQKLIKQKEGEISNLKEENGRLKTENQQLKRAANRKTAKSGKETVPPIKVYTTSEIENLGEGKRIGKGATSEVFEVFHTEKLAKKVLDVEISQAEKSDTKSDDNDDDEVALKISIEDVKRLIRECEALNSLNHPNIVKTYGFYFGDEKHAPAILLEHCESNLKKRIKKLTNEE